MEILTPEDVAAILKVPAKTVVQLCRQRRLHAVKAGRRWRIPRASLDAFFAPAAPAPEQRSKFNREEFLKLWRDRG